MSKTKDQNDVNSVEANNDSNSRPTQESPVLKADDKTAKVRNETKRLPSMPGSSHDESATRPRKEHTSDFYRTHIMGQEKTLHRMLSVPQTRELRAPFEVTRVTLHIRGMKEHVVLTAERVVILGRADLRADGFKPDIDLTPYGGRERGVSRAHVRLHVQDGKLFMTDLYSANGTFMGGERMVAEKAYELHNGDELLLGALGIRVEVEGD